MTCKIAIHKSRNSFSERWIDYCEKNNIEYKIVDAYSSNIIHDIEDCECFMWHFNHTRLKDTLFAKQLLYSLEISGKKVFPNYKTCWHFDDKVGQKYLLESINAPFAPTFTFYSKEEALTWIENATFPKVFKLRGGSGSLNVQLAKNKIKAKHLVNRSFGNGFSKFNRFTNLRDNLKGYIFAKKTSLDILKSIYRFFFGTSFSRNSNKERGYAYFQEFIPNNLCDYRVHVVNNHCWAIKRLVRKNDFRASGSGNVIYGKEDIPIEIIKISYDVCKKLELQSVAFDFVKDIKNNKYLIVEMSYGYGIDTKEYTYGYWDESLNWHSTNFNPEGAMVEALVEMCDKY